MKWVKSEFVQLESLHVGKHIVGQMLIYLGTDTVYK